MGSTLDRNLRQLPAFCSGWHNIGCVTWFLVHLVDCTAFAKTDAMNGYYKTPVTSMLAKALMVMHTIRSESMRDNINVSHSIKRPPSALTLDEHLLIVSPHILSLSSTWFQRNRKLFERNHNALFASVRVNIDYAESNYML